jgi:ferredoxin
MTRQCAWCATYLDFVQSETCVTHGICESCVERIRRSIVEELTPPSDDRVMVDAHPRSDLTPSISAR